MVFESKEGRLAIRARVTVDCTGDGDIFGGAGASADTDIEERDIHHCMNTAWIWGGCEMERWIEFKTRNGAGFSDFMERSRALCGGLFERPFVSWRNDVALFMGPRLSGYFASPPMVASIAGIHTVASHLNCLLGAFYGSSRPNWAVR